jgi:RNA polymerase sigma-70 factor, ECF subfamily
MLVSPVRDDDAVESGFRLAMPSSSSSSKTTNNDRTVTLVRTQMPNVWRFLRRLGFTPADADDAAQEIFVIAAKKIDHIEEGRERAFLYGIAVRLANRHRRNRARHNEKQTPSADIDAFESARPNADELLDQKEARALLDRILDSMSQDLRTTFTLFELEEMTMIEIAAVTDTPMGTVASRLRRAREHFQAAVRRYQASQQDETATFNEPVRQS